MIARSRELSPSCLNLVPSWQKTHGNATSASSKMHNVEGKRPIATIFLGVIGALGLICAGLLALYLLTAGEQESRTTDTKSTQLTTSAERVEFLARYLKLRTHVTDAAFHIVYHDNSGGLPGPSDWSIAAAVRVAPADGTAWLAGARPLQATDPVSARIPETAGLIPAEWHVSSAGERYERDGALIVWHSEGVLEFAGATE